MFKPVIVLASAALLFNVAPLHAQDQGPETSGHQTSKDHRSDTASPYMRPTQNRNLKLSSLATNDIGFYPKSQRAEQAHINQTNAKRQTVPVEDRSISTPDHWHNDDRGS